MTSCIDHIHQGFPSEVGFYIYESESIAIRNRNIMEYGSEHRKVMCTARETQECYVRTWDRNRD